MHTISGNKIQILTTYTGDIKKVLENNRNISKTEEDAFFFPHISNLHNPFLLPDMEKAVHRILEAKIKQERVVIFGDYDVDGVSSTTILVRFFGEIGIPVSYRLPHRVHDGYGLKSYFFDELQEKDVKLVVTVDCGTRDIEPIQYAKSLGIDVIVTDHHAVPERVPEEVIAIINPKRPDSSYPFRDLAGAGVALKLVHGILIAMNTNDTGIKNEERIHTTLTKYLDFASLGTVADCMPLLGENRTITTLGLRQMQNSESAGLQKFLNEKQDIEGNADLIGFQIGPRINAAGRMDTPMTALRWLLAGEDRCDDFFSELEALNENRRNITESQYTQTLENIDTEMPILLYDATNLDHGIIGLVAGRLTETYNKPAIIIKNGHDYPLTKRKGDETLFENSVSSTPGVALSIGSCRAPEWCNLIELLDSCREFFVRYGGHRQAAGFTIETERVPAFREKIQREIEKRHDIHNLPKKTLHVECILPIEVINTDILRSIDIFRPYGIGNSHPLWLIEDITIENIRPLGQDEKHLSLTCQGYPHLRFVIWNPDSLKRSYLIPGNIVSLIIEIQKNEWKGNITVQGVIKDIVIS